MERHIAKRLGMPCAVISAPVHVQDFPARYSPQMGFEGANVLFDTWVHPLMMGLEEHLLGDVPRGPRVPRRRRALASRRAAARRAPAAPRAAPQPAPGRTPAWAADAEKELRKIPFFVRGKARRNTERFAARARPRHRSPSRRCTMPKRISAAERRRRSASSIVTLDNHLASAVERARTALAPRDAGPRPHAPRRRRMGRRPGRARAPAGPTSRAADIVIATMLFMEDHVRGVLPDLRARRDACDAMVGCMSAGEVMKLTRIGRFTHGRPAAAAPLAFLKRLRGKPARTGTPAPARADEDAAAPAARSCASSPAPRRTCGPIS